VLFVIITIKSLNPTVTRDTGIILPQLCDLKSGLFASQNWHR